MIAAGWLEEVRALVAKGISPNTKPFQFIGYRELADHIDGKISLEEAVSRIQQATRQFAKRQITWFRREPDVRWIEGFGTDRAVIEKATEIVSNEAQV
jgi:tRNA dimethylallyltransferase